jgi:hypothetical protein
MFRRTVGYAAALAACITIGSINSADALIVSMPQPIYLGLVDKCQVYWTPSGLNNYATPPEKVGTCAVDGNGGACSPPADYLLTKSACLGAAPEVCEDDECTPWVTLPYNNCLNSTC